jgi:hypothetical protein
MVMTRKAIDDGWPLTEEKLAEIARDVTDIVSDPTRYSPRDRLAAARVVNSLVKTRQFQRENDADPDEADPDALPLSVLSDEDLDDLARLADRLSGAIPPPGEGGG